MLIALQRAVDRLNRVIVVLSSLALVAASLVMSASVAVRYFFKMATDWQDEVAIFLLVAATFLSAAHVQAQRGHVAIEAIREILPPAVERVRRLLAEGLSTVFCGFFSWKSWTLLAEAWSEGQVTNSSWGPPLWIPYLLMAAGMSLLTVQLALHSVQSASSLVRRGAAP